MSPFPSFTKILFLGFLLKISIGGVLLGFQTNESSINESSTDDISLYILSNQYESLLEQRINTRLSYYFPSSSFIVAVDINLLENNYTKGTGSVNPGQQPEDQSLWTAVPQFLLSEESTPDEINNELAAALGINLNNILVQVNLDQNAGYTNQDQTFIRFAIENIIKYEEERGDQINIQSRLFPNALLADNPTTGLSNQRMFSLMDSIGASLNPNQLGNNQVAAMAESLENRINLLFLGFLFIFGVVVALFFIRRKRDDQNAIGSNNPVVITGSNQSFFREDVTASNEIIRNLNHTIRNEGLIEYSLNKDDNKEDRETESLRFLMKLTSERPTDMARILEFWFNSDKEKTIQTILSIDLKILMMLSPYITKSVYKDIVGIMNDLMEQDHTDFKYSLEELAREIKAYEQPQSFIFKYQPVKDFNFIQLLKEKEITLLLAMLSLRDIALVFSHLSRDMLLKISAKMDTTLLNNVIKQMYIIQKITLSEYRRRAGQIFKEIHLNQEYDHLPDSLVTDVVSIIEGLEIDKQQEIIHGMKLDVDTNTAEIAQNVITLESIHDLDNVSLEKVIKPIKMDVLALAIKGFKEEFQERLLGFRPERERVYIKKILSSEQSSVAEIKVAQGVLLRELRKVVKELNIQETIET